MKLATNVRSLAVALAGVALSLMLVTGDALAAKRLGGGGSVGMQRQSVAAPKPATPAQNQAAPAQPAHQQPVATPPQAQPKRSWMGPLAGLAAGIGLAALASHFGFGEELASMMMIGLLVVAAIAVVGMIMRRRAPAQPAYAGAGADYAARVEPGPAVATAYTAPTAAGGSSVAVPADFDTEGFLRHAKVNFIRLQAANDAGNLDDIREFTAPEMFAEIKLAMGERGQTAQETDVVALTAELLDVTEEAQRYVASVLFNGQMREARNAPAEPFSEIWHLTKPRDGSSGWVLAGIQQAGN